jgi:N-acetylneuraminic acid mutarotase
MIGGGEIKDHKAGFHPLGRLFMPFPLIMVSFFLGISLCVTQTSFSQEAIGPWSVKADMPTPRRAPAAVALDGKVYVIGGQNGKYYNVVERYDPATDIWETKAPMPTERAWLVAEAVNGRIYAIGGNNPISGKLGTVEEYDPITDTWTTKSPMPTPRDDAVSGLVKGKIYVIGGWQDSALDAVEEYDPTTDTWTTKPSMIEARAMASSAVLNEKIYVFGGFDGLGDRRQSYAFDPASDTWLALTDIPTSRSRTAAGVAAGMIFVLGGYNTGVVERFDSETNVWETMTQMPIERGDIAATVVADVIYVFGGRLAWGEPALNYTVAGDFSETSDVPGTPVGGDFSDTRDVQGSQEAGDFSKMREVSGVPVSVDVKNDRGAGGCFIATAAYGSPTEPHVETLREFRDRYLLTNSLGESIVGLYYKYSPQLANFISKHDTLRCLVSFGLTPVVALSWIWLETGTTIALAFLLFFTAVAGLSATVFTRRRRKPVCARGSGNVTHKGGYYDDT